MTEALDALERCGGRLRVDGSELLDFDDAGVALLVALGRYGASLGVQVELAGAPLLMRCAIETRGFGTLFTWTPKVPWAAIAGAVRDPVTVPSGRRWGAALNG